MGDQFGLVVLVLLIIVLAGGAFLMQHGRRGVANDTLNTHLDESGKAAYDVGHGNRLVGNPPIDVITRDGAGTAVPGQGALRPDDPEETDVRHLSDES